MIKQKCKNIPFFIEFNGLPGSGKTTICKELCELLTSDGYSVFFITDYLQEVLESHFARSKLFLSEIKYGVFKITYYYIRIYLSIPDRNIYDLKYCFFSLLNYLGCRKCQREINKSFIVSDEGIIQYLFSVFFDRNIRDFKFVNKILIMFNREFPNLVLIDIDVSYEEARKRIRGRKNGKSRLDSLHSSDQGRILKIQMDNLNKIRNIGKFITIVNISSEVNSKEVAGKIRACFLGVQ